jgi:predicted Rdx family selenoprotein
VADLLKRELELETKLMPGATGEFTVWVNGTKVAEKGYDGFPSEPDVLQAAAATLKAN